MHTGRRLPRGLLVAVGFGVFIAVSYGVASILSLWPSAEQDCIARCKMTGKRGEMTPIYRWEQTAGMRSKGPMECACR